MLAEFGIAFALVFAGLSCLLGFIWLLVLIDRRFGLGWALLAFMLAYSTVVATGAVVLP